MPGVVPFEGYGAALRLLRAPDPTRDKPADGGTICTNDAPAPVTVTPRSDSRMPSMPAEPQPCEKLSLLRWLTALPLQRATAQPGLTAPT